MMHSFTIPTLAFLAAGISAAAIPQGLGECADLLEYKDLKQSAPMFVNKMATGASCTSSIDQVCQIEKGYAVTVYIYNEQST